MRPVQAVSINMQKCSSLHSDGVEEMLNGQRVVLPLSVTAWFPARAWLMEALWNRSIPDIDPSLAPAWGSRSYTLLLIQRPPVECIETASVHM